MCVVFYTTTHGVVVVFVTSIHTSTDSKNREIYANYLANTFFLSTGSCQGVIHYWSVDLCNWKFISHFSSDCHQPPANSQGILIFPHKQWLPNGCRPVSRPVCLRLFWLDPYHHKMPCFCKTSVQPKEFLQPYAGKPKECKFKASLFRPTILHIQL